MRNSVEDVAKLVGAAGIAWFHVGAPGAWIGHAALLVFVALAVMHTARSSASIPVLTRTRAARLLTPWLVWSALYATLKFAQASLEGQPISKEFSGWMLLTGPAIHLWFLPFVLVAGIASVVLVRCLTPAPRIVAEIACFALFAASLLLPTELPTPFAQWAHVAPAVAFGIALAAGRSIFVPLACLVLVANTPGLLLGLTACLAVVNVRLPSTRMTILAGETSLYLYLAHPAVAAFAYLAELQRGSPVTALTVIAVSTVAAAGLVKLPLMRMQKGEPKFRPTTAIVMRRASR